VPRLSGVSMLGRQTDSETDIVRVHESTVCSQEVERTEPNRVGGRCLSCPQKYRPRALQLPKQAVPKLPTVVYPRGCNEIILRAERSVRAESKATGPSMCQRLAKRAAKSESKHPAPLDESSSCKAQ
jgi:hypothetical protein